MQKMSMILSSLELLEMLLVSFLKLHKELVEL